MDSKIGMAADPRGRQEVTANPRKDPRNMSDGIVWLEPHKPVDESIIGGKAAGLRVMIDLGLKVPPGFVVTPAAYERCIGPQLSQRISDMAGGIDAGSSVEHIEHFAAQLRASLQERIIDPDDLTDIKRAYDRLGELTGVLDPPVAVRSSSVAEDDRKRSFAGAHDTFLWVVGKAEVVQRIRQCWASLYTARAMAYRLGTPEAARPAMAVLVQQMVSAEAAGVMITLNPANGDRSKILIEVVWGLGEPLVAGEVNPDRFLADRITAQVIRKDIARKPTRRVWDRTGGRALVTEPVGPQDQEVSSLKDHEIQHLVWIGRQIESQYGSAQVVEFAMANGEVHILQCRPETTWNQKPHRTFGIHNRPIDQVVSTLLSSGKRKPA